ncbi:leucyl aminopeptidase, partial [Sulfolobus sp. F3]
MITLYRYEIFLDFNGPEYYGNEKIQMVSDEDKLEIDSVGIEILEVKADGNSVRYDVNNDKLVVYSKVGKELEIRFKGRASDKSIVGIYIAPYDNNKKYIVTTQFEASHARRFIPCFDVPYMKARFKLFVRVDRGLKVISNMPIVSFRDDGG